MSVQFGRWKLNACQCSAAYTEDVSAVLAPYGPDSDERYASENITIVYRAFSTTKEARGESQPYTSRMGALITWDGRLDNRTELIKELGSPLAPDSTDLTIVATAYDKWGFGCFAKLIGDWALAIWNPNDRSLVLAKDPIGTRYLYYSVGETQVTWSTILDPLILFADRTFKLNEDYVASWLAMMFPAAHLTPFLGIDSVPPSSYVRLQPGRYGIKRIIKKYWDFDPAKRISYSSDREYEEHFRTVFATAVRRRLRADRPILAELSGGMDSSSIVCMADWLIGECQAECPRLDTMTWYDDARPSWGERAYFTEIEEQRGRTGYHIDVGCLAADDSAAAFVSQFDDSFAALPIPKPSSEFFQKIAAFMASGGYRVRISGIGGEEPTGGCTPSPAPELQNLLVRLRFLTLARQSKAWAQRMRRNQLSLLWGALRDFFPLKWHRTPEELYSPPIWLRADFLRRNRSSFGGYRRRIRVLGALPSFQAHMQALDCERRVMAFFRLEPRLLHEARYPFHDRDLREFAYGVPCEQLVRVGERRSLMRRALVGIVPDAVLNRKVKPLAAPNGNTGTSTKWLRDIELDDFIGSSLRIIDADALKEALRNIAAKDDVSLERLKRTLTVELWLHHLARHGVLDCSNAVTTRNILCARPAQAAHGPRAQKFS